MIAWWIRRAKDSEATLQFSGGSSFLRQSFSLLQPRLTLIQLITIIVTDQPRRATTVNEKTVLCYGHEACGTTIELTGHLEAGEPTMARQRKGKEKEVKIKLKQPDRSGPDPSKETLLALAERQGLLKVREVGDESEEEDENEPLTGRLADALLWSISLTMLHFTLDVLVTHQYAVELSWPIIIRRAAQAFPSKPSPQCISHLTSTHFTVILLLLYSFHPHPSPSIFLPRLPPRIQPVLHQLLFFVCSVAAGCYLIHVSNRHGYYAIMKQAPPLGCLWVWAVIELDLFWATGSLISCIVFLKYGGYSYL